MKREEAKEILRIKLSELRRAEIMLEMNENGVREMKEDIKELEAIINKKIEEEKPLFVTEDGVDVFDENYIVYCITRNYYKHKAKYMSMQKIESYLKVFAHESNADEYILWNKPLLSLQEIDATIKGHLPEFDELKKLAEERLNHER